MSIVLFWIVSILVGLNVFINFVVMFGGKDSETRATNAVAFLINATILTYTVFFSIPKP